MHIPLALIGQGYITCPCLEKRLEREVECSCLAQVMEGAGKPRKNQYLAKSCAVSLEVGGVFIILLGYEKTKRVLPVFKLVGVMG